jgi:hypothetical protein
MVIFMSGIRSLQLVFCCAAVMFLVGCGAKYGTPVKVTGKVTADDKPLANAVVTAAFNGEREAEFRSFSATTGPGGEFEFPEIYPGEYTVTVTELPAAGAESQNLGMQSAIPTMLVPAAGADMKLTVADAPVTFDIKMTKGR